jgi:DNA primase large subunit
VQFSTVQYSTVQCRTVQYRTVQYSTVQYSIVQYSTVQYSNISQHLSTAQHNIIDSLHNFLGQARDAFQKSYSYSFRHMYGKEGSRKDYTPFSCMKIIMGAAPEAGAYHGCPYRLEHV